VSREGRKQQAKTIYQFSFSICHFSLERNRQVAKTQRTQRRKPKTSSLCHFSILIFLLVSAEGQGQREGEKDSTVSCRLVLIRGSLLWQR
jgi:hypothetical protein